MGRKNSKKKKKERYFDHEKTLKGVLDISRSGMGFVMVENLPVDVIVRSGDFNTGLHGDTVSVKINKDKGGRRMQGVVADVLRRKQTEFMGKMQINDARPDDAAGRGCGFCLAETEKPMPDIFIPRQNFNGAKDNDRVVVRLLEWEKDGRRPVGEVVSIMDEEDSNDVAMKEILLENGFPLEFSEEALEEASRIPDTISNEEIKKRKDVRDVLTFTIDPIDAKDFDDAISFRVLKNGNYEIGVHIADVAHYVAEDTALDKAAYEKATSAYLPDRVNPMLPEHISNALCSLRPHEDSLTFSAVFQITPKAQVKQHWLGKTVIHSDYRFTYEEVQEIIETKEGLYSEEILVLNHLAQRFRKQRFKNGAINFSSQEVRFKLDENKKPVGIIIKESKEAHQLIEEFMLLANRTVAADLSKIKLKNKPIPFPYRVHDNPDEEKLIPFVAFARKFGHKFDTSSPDVMVHRILRQTLEKNFHIDKKMEQKCKHCSERERAAMEAERAANKYKQVEYMQNFLGEEFEGVISGVASFGFWVETVEHKCEGLVSINSLLDFDDFRHVETDYCLVGQRSGRKFRMGDKVWIKVVAANLTKRQLDYEWVVASGLKDGKKREPKDK